MDSFQSSRPDLIRRSQTPQTRSPPVCLPLIHTRTPLDTTSTTEASSNPFNGTLKCKSCSSKKSRQSDVSSGGENLLINDQTFSSPGCDCPSGWRTQLAREEREGERGVRWGFGFGRGGQEWSDEGKKTLTCCSCGAGANPSGRNTKEKAEKKRSGTETFTYGIHMGGREETPH